ncbi:MAG: HAD hydrolase-like protein [Myxococcaceae bacterium]
MRVNVFLDLDGTLVDCRQRIHALFTELTAGYGPPLGFDEYWALKRAQRSNPWLLEHRFQTTAAQRADFTAAWMREIEQPARLALDQPFPWTLGVLEALSSRHTLFVVTDRQREDGAIDQAQRLGLARFLREVLVTQQRLDKAALIRSRVPVVTPADVLVGDTGRDVEAARQLEIRAGVVLSGVRSRESLARYAPDFILDSLAELPAILSAPP